MAFEPSASWNSRSITHLANYPSRSLPMNSSDESDLKMRLVKKGWVANSLEGFDIDRAKALLEATRANHDRPPGAIVLSEMRRKELRPVVSSDTGGFFQPNPIMLNALEDELEGQLKKDFAVLKARTLTV